jgi:hypothetical protein
MLLLAVLTVKRTCPSWLISTQQGAVWKSGKGDEPIDARVPSLPSLKAEIVPLPAPPRALETNNWVGSVGRNSPRTDRGLGRQTAKPQLLLAGRPSRR